MPTTRRKPVLVMVKKCMAQAGASIVTDTAGKKRKLQDVADEVADTDTDDDNPRGTKTRMTKKAAEDLPQTHSTAAMEGSPRELPDDSESSSSHEDDSSYDPIDSENKKAESDIPTKELPQTHSTAAMEGSPRDLSDDFESSSSNENDSSYHQIDSEDEKAGSDIPIEDLPQIHSTATKEANPGDLPEDSENSSSNEDDSSYDLIDSEGVKAGSEIPTEPDTSAEQSGEDGEHDDLLRSIVQAQELVMLEKGKEIADLKRLNGIMISQLRQVQEQVSLKPDKAIAHLKRLNEIMTFQLRQAQEDLRQKDREFKRLVEDTERMGTTGRHNADLDGILETKFLDLRLYIESFVRNTCVSHFTSGDTLELTDLHNSMTYVPAAQLLRSGLHGRLFAQGVIWRSLARILKGPFRVWGPGYYTFLREFADDENVSLSRRELWRILTGGLLNDSRSPLTEVVERLEERLMSQLEPLFMKGHNEPITEHIKLIVAKAIELAKLLARFRARTIVKSDGFEVPVIEVRGRKQQPYDAKWMDVLERSVHHAGNNIDFVITPALAEVTNSAGEPFNSPRVLVKAQVCCGKDYHDFYVPEGAASSAHTSTRKKMKKH